MTLPIQLCILPLDFLILPPSFVCLFALVLSAKLAKNFVVVKTSKCITHGASSTAVTLT